MEIVETSFFTKRILEFIDDDVYRKFQSYISENPTKGSLVKGGGGIRKIRWALQGQGKSGGMRVIYYYKVVKSTIYLLYVYRKNEQETLSDKQTAVLAALAKEFENER